MINNDMYNNFIFSMKWNINLVNVTEQMRFKKYSYEDIIEMYKKYSDSTLEVINNNDKYNCSEIWHIENCKESLENHIEDIKTMIFKKNKSNIFKYHMSNYKYIKNDIENDLRHIEFWENELNKKIIKVRDCQAEIKRIQNIGNENVVNEIKSINQDVMVVYGD